MTQPVEPIARTIEANGLQHNVLEWDIAGADTTVVLLHGFLDLAWSFEHVALKLAPRYHVIAPDLRGHGDTDWVGAGGYYYFPDYTADLARVLPALVRKRVYLVGHSMGGVVATQYTGTFPEQVQKLALLEGTGPPGGNLADAPARMLKHIETVDEARARGIRPLDSLAAATERLRQIYQRLEPAWAARLAEKATRPAADGPPGGRIWKHDPLHRTRSPLIFLLPLFEAFIKRIACPVLLVNAAESKFTFLHDPERQALFPKAQVRTLADAGHMMQLDQPEAL
ncbi:MAG TPA: alpha/beta hydrolase, partial [Burkholderiales bacterium]|nr:alpha/beta hydrolase [Burkholderiales bacterium]